MTQKYDLNFQIIVINMQVSNSQKWGFPDGSVVKNPGDQVQSLGWEYSPEKEMTIHFGFIA